MNPEEEPPELKPSDGKQPTIHDRIVWLLLRCCGIACSIEEVQVRALRPEKKWHLLPSKVHAASGTTLALAKDLYDAENDRIRHVDDKAKALLSATSILFTLTGAIVALTANRENAAFRWLVCGALALLLVTLFSLLGVYFGLNPFAQPTLTSDTAAQLEGGSQNELIRDYQKSTWLNAQVLAFLVATYRASQRLFLCSMLVLGIAGLAALFTNHPNELVVRQLQNDPEFIRKIQGPKGDPGPAGAKGDPGPPGSSAPTIAPPP